jgi:CheY-like chemotaxis protein
MRAGFRVLLEKIPRIEIVGEAGDGREALELIRKRRPQVAIVGLGLSKLNGFEVIARVRKESPQVKAILASLHAGKQYVVQALLAGASSYLAKVFVNAAEQVDGPVCFACGFLFRRSDEVDCADKVDEFAKAVLVERGTGVILRKDSFKTRIVALDRDHRVIDDLADGGLLGAVLKVSPTCGGRHPENVYGFIFVGIFCVRTSIFPLPFDKLCVVLFKGVGDVLQEDEAEDNVLVLCSIHVAAEFVGSEPEFGFEADIGGIVCGFVRGGATGHCCATLLPANEASDKWRVNM